jgi:hypothetical protein
MKYDLVFVMALFTGDVEQRHAIGFLNQANCWEWVALRGRDIRKGQYWIGTCMPFEAFRVGFPGMELENDS